MSKHTHRIAQVTEWTGPFAGQTHICLIDKRAMGEEIVSRHTTMTDAQIAYKAAVKALRS